jgi:hypothetical protein
MNYECGQRISLPDFSGLHIVGTMGENAYFRESERTDNTSELKCTSASG